MTAVATTPTRTGTRTAGTWKTVAATTVAAAAATETLVAVARASGIDVAIQGQDLKPGGCATVLLMCMVAAVAVLGAVRRWAISPARTWVRTTVALTVVSFVPDVTVPDTSTSTRLVLMAAHVVAAAIVIPAIARKLPASR